MRVPPNNPGDGYEFVEAGDELRRGDEYCLPGGRWVNTEISGRVVMTRSERRRRFGTGAVSVQTYGFYRRRIEQ